MRHLAVFILAVCLAGAVANEAPVPFPFAFPGTKGRTMPPTMSMFGADCFRFIYKAMGAAKSDPAKLPQLVMPLCLGGNQAQCKAWIADLVRATKTKEDQQAAGVETRGHGYGKWCTQLHIGAESAASDHPLTTTELAKLAADDGWGPKTATNSTRKPSEQQLGRWLKASAKAEEAEAHQRKTTETPLVAPVAKAKIDEPVAAKKELMSPSHYARAKRAAKVVAPKPKVEEAPKPEAVVAKVVKLQPKKEAAPKQEAVVAKPTSPESEKVEHLLPEAKPEVKSRFTVVFDKPEASQVKETSPLQPSLRKPALKGTTKTGNEDPSQCACIHRNGKKVCHCVGDSEKAHHTYAKTKPSDAHPVRVLKANEDTVSEVHGMAIASDLEGKGEDDGKLDQAEDLFDKARQAAKTARRLKGHY